MKIQPDHLWFTLFFGLVTAVGVGPLAGCATHQSARDFTDDKSLRLRVPAALGDNPDYKFEGVSISVSNGVVRLDGYVDLFPQKVKAGSIVLQIPGVKDVEDNLTVRQPGTHSVGSSGDDESLTAQVKSVLSSNTDYEYEEVNVAAFEGTVQLGGFVDTPDQKNRASDLARAVPGVKDVLNNITVKAVL